MSLYEEIKELNKTVSPNQYNEYLKMIMSQMEEAITHGLLPPIRQKERFSTITDSQGTWLRDNETGIEYSKQIGLHLIDR